MAEDGSIRIFPNCLGNPGQFMWKEKIVRIQKVDPIGLRFLYAPIPWRSRPAAGFLGKKANARITKRFDHRPGIICGAIVNDDEFKLLQRLIQNTSDISADDAGPIVSRNDDGKVRPGVHKMSRRATD
jgi:hypothetical protein